ncbi:MAG: Single-stranded DNA-binding protein ssb [Firmicutes bacterium ADurb.Bin193]|nr:MAG: Single-stranded DNA-binding protein ssb [Firmicutes bacterium ADurb.Bin193]
MLNKVILIGRLVRDVEVKTVGNDTKLANFTLAVDRRFKSKAEDQPTADFIPVSVWRKSAEFAESYFHKGKQVYVCGALETYTYEQNGEKRYGFRVNADDIGFADSAKADGSNKPADDGNEFAAPPMGDFPMGDQDALGDDLPF